MIEATDLAVIETYEQHGETWACLRGDKLPERSWLDRFCALPPTGAAVLDIGCGAGVPIARELIRRGFDVTGLDGSQAMLALFHRNLPGRSAILCDMRRLTLGRRFAGLLAWDSFFHLSPADQRPMFARFRDHALPGAALMFTSGDEEGSAIGDLEGSPLYHGSLSPGEYRDLLDRNGFDVVDQVSKDASCGYRTVWLARQRP